jgi:hypothetical protein
VTRATVSAGMLNAKNVRNKPEEARTIPRGAKKNGSAIGNIKGPSQLSEVRVENTTADSTRIFLRHLVATLAYRASKVLRDAPAGFAEFFSSPGARVPVQILAHMADLMGWAVRMAQGENLWRPEGTGDWDTEMRRFFEGLLSLDRILSSDAVMDRTTAMKLTQAPLADVLTHVGQLAMLRGASGAPVRPESYARAPIVVGIVGLDQAPPGFEFDGDASARS